jgi:hypothetical protein
MKIMPEFGTVRENAAAFDVAVAAITSGDLAWGHGILVALRDHIQSTAEHKSVQWILPKVLEALEALDTTLLTTASPSVRSTRNPAGAPLQRYAQR